MRKILYSFAVFVLFSTLLFISGCSNVVVVDGHVATVAEIYTSGGSSAAYTYAFAYDQYGRRIQQIYTQAGTSDTTTTTYSSYSFVNDTTRSNGIVSTNTYSLDAGLETHDKSGTHYSYDNNGYLITSGIPPNVTVNTISNGNVIKSIQYQPGVDTITTTYTPAVNRDYRNFGINFNGKPNQNLTATSQQITSQFGTLSTVNGAYTYTFDGHGRVKTMNVTYTGTGFTATDDFVFTYTTQ